MYINGQIGYFLSGNSWVANGAILKLIHDKSVYKRYGEYRIGTGPVKKDTLPSQSGASSKESTVGAFACLLPISRLAPGREFVQQRFGNVPSTNGPL